MPGAGDRVSQVVPVVKNLPANAGDIRDVGLILGWEDPWRRKWQPTPVSLPGESHGQRSLAGYSSQGHEELDTTQPLSTHKCWGYISDQNRQGLHPRGVYRLVREINDKQLEKLIYEQRL